MRRLPKWCLTPFVVLLAFAPAARAAGPEPQPSAQFRAETRAFLEAAASRAPIPPTLPQVDEDDPVLPDNRVVAIYGAPQLGLTALGERSPRKAAKLAVRQARPYDEADRSAVPALDLIGVVANSTPGSDRKYRTRQPAELIDEYLQAARSVGARLMLDIQPGRSPILDEIAYLEPWLSEPDVDVAIDPEWNVGRRGVPGKTVGSVKASEVNVASRALQRIVADEDLPPKVLVVHQFRKGSVRKRRQVRQRDDVAVTLNFDGIGAPGPKIAGYEALSTDGVFNGFSVFYRLDSPVMKPREVLALDPVVDFLLYQ